MGFSSFKPLKKGKGSRWIVASWVERLMGTIIELLEIGIPGEHSVPGISHKGKFEVLLESFFARDFTDFPGCVMRIVFFPSGLTKIQVLVIHQGCSA